MLGYLARRFIKTVGYSKESAPSRSRLRSELRASASGVSIRWRTCETVYLVLVGCTCLLGLTAACTSCGGGAGVFIVGGGHDTGQADVQAVKDLEAAWLNDAALKDPARFASYYAEDALALSPNAPLIAGKNKIQAGLTTLMADPNFALTFHSTRVEASKGGDMVYTIGAYSRTVSDPKSKQPVTGFLLFGSDMVKEYVPTV